MNRFRILAHRLICRIFGHMIVGQQAIYTLQRIFYSDKCEAICIRCGKEFNAIKESVDLALQESPVQRAIREKYGEAFSGGTKLQEPFSYEWPKP